MCLENQPKGRLPTITWHIPWHLCITIKYIASNFSCFCVYFRARITCTNKLISSQTWNFFEIRTHSNADFTFIVIFAFPWHIFRLWTSTFSIVFYFFSYCWLTFIKFLAVSNFLNPLLMFSSIIFLSSKERCLPLKLIINLLYQEASASLLYNYNLILQ